MKREEFINWIKEKGYKKEGRECRYKKEGRNGNIYAFKVSNISARYEVQVVYAETEYRPRKVQWIRIASGYLKDLHINEKGKVAGMRT